MNLVIALCALLRILMAFRMTFLIFFIFHSMRFVSADILLRLIKDLNPSKSKTSEIFVSMTCVDACGLAVGASNVTVYRTNGVEVSSNVAWGQEAVFDKTSGFLQAVHAHIEVCKCDFTLFIDNSKCHLY
jgi:hypothetical protein